MPVEVLHPGLLTTVQDGGRHGLYSLGVPPSGAMDDFSFRVANLLVGNDEGAAALERRTWGRSSPSARSASSPSAAPTCGRASTARSGPPGEAFAVEAGQVLSFDHLRAGARCYVAISGGVDVPEVLGSRSTFARVSLGGHEGRALARATSWRAAPRTACRAPVGARLDEAERPVFGKEVEIRIVLGLYSHRLTADSLAAFLETDWVVTPNADRVGYRYRGVELPVRRARRGALRRRQQPVEHLLAQLPLRGDPAARRRRADRAHEGRRHGGNYASAGTVITADLDRVAQSKTHEKTRFVPVGIEEALDARTARRLPPGADPRRLAGGRRDLAVSPSSAGARAPPGGARASDDEPRAADHAADVGQRARVVERRGRRRRADDVAGPRRVAGLDGEEAEQRGRRGCGRGSAA